MNLTELYRALGDKIAESKEYLERKFQAWMQDHLSKDNPHGTTPDGIGAARASITVQGKPLTENVVLTPGDLNALPADGVAESAQKLANPRLIRVVGAVTGEVPFDGAANVQLSVTTGVAPIRYEYPTENSIHTFYDDPQFPTSALATFDTDGLVASCVIYEPKRDVSYAYTYDSEKRLVSVTPTIIRDELPHYEIGTTPVLTQETVTQLLDHLDPVKVPDPHTQYQLKP